MNKGLFLCGLFIALFLAGCGDPVVRDDKRQVIACTYLIYVEKNSDGEKIDRWLPVRPEELRWRYLRVNFDQLKNIE